MKWISRDPLSRVDIKYKLPLGFLVLYVVLFGIGGYFVADSIYGPLNREILERLENETLARAAIFDRKLETLVRRAQDFSSDGLIRSETERLARASDRPPDAIRDALTRLRDHLRHNKLTLVPEFFDLEIFDPADRLLVKVDERRRPMPWSNRPQQWSDPQISALVLDPGSAPSAAIHVPIWNLERTAKIGYLSCIVDLATLVENTYPMPPGDADRSDSKRRLVILDRNSLGLEFPGWYLQNAGAAGTPVNEGRWAGLREIPPGGDFQLSGHRGRHVCTRGDEMFGQSFPLGTTGWNLLIEADAARALVPLRAVEGQLVGIIITVAIAGLILLFFPVQYLVRPLGELQRMAFRLKDGDFSVRNRIRSEDEIGHLARTFNLMAEAIEERTRTLMATAHDLRRREREATLQHDRLQTVVNSMTDGLLLLNAEGDLVLSNAAAQPLVRRLGDKTTLLSIRKCQLHDEPGDSCADCLLDPRQTTACEVAMEGRIYEVVTTALPSRHGESGKLLVARDITERERVNERQAQEERLAVLGKTAAVVAHELNSPLAAISMYNQMMAAELSPGSPFAEHVDVVYRNTHACQKIVRELLDYARTPSPRRRRVELLEILHDVVRFVRPLDREGRIEIAEPGPSTPSAVWGDPTQLQQVFVNLLNNAVQAAKASGGKVELRISRADPGRVLVDIQDDGPGVSPEKRPQIFEPFFTTKSAGGTGLGLPTAQRIVRAHGGSLDLVSSEPGRTIFRVVLPQCPEQQTSECEQASQVAGP